MAVKASATITLSSIRDIQSVTWYYLLQSSTSAAPSKPTVSPPGGNWSDTEPGYTAGSTNSLYTVERTIFTDGTFEYSNVCLDSSYEAAKQAYNKAQTAQDTVDSLEIGGRNLVRNGDFSKDTENWTNWGSPTTREIVTVNGRKWMHLLSSTKTYQGYQQGNKARIESNQDYTISFRAIGAYVTMGIHWRDSSGNIKSQDWKTFTDGSDTAETVHSVTFNSHSDASIVQFNLMIGDGSTTVHEMWVTDIKLEKGNRATDWTPAPEDVQADIDKALSSVEVVVGTQTGQTNVWTGMASFSTLQDGQAIQYWLPYTSSAVKWYTGTAITGTDTTPTVFSNSGITSAKVDEQYLNTSTNNVYRCTVAGNAATAKWAYFGNVSGTSGTSSNQVTLNLKLPNGTMTGAKNVYVDSTTRCTSHVSAGNMVQMVYRSGIQINGSGSYTGWWISRARNDNTYDRIRLNNLVKAKTAITASYLLVGDSGGYFHLAAGSVFDTNNPILWSGSAIDAGGTGNNNYLSFPSCTLRNNAGSSWTATQYSTLYLAGTIAGNKFTVAASDWLTTNPSDAALTYISLGYMYSTYQMYLYPEHPMFRIVNGVLKDVNQMAMEVFASSGGQNLLRWTGESQVYSEHNSTERRWYEANTYAPITTVNNVFTATVDRTSTNLTTGFRFACVTEGGLAASAHPGESTNYGIDMQPGDTFTYSVDIRTDGNSIRLAPQYYDGSSVWAEITSATFTPADTDWHRYSVTFTIPVSGFVCFTAIANGIEPTLNKTGSFKNMKLERGPTATPWSAAPEDNDALLDSDVLQVTSGSVKMGDISNGAYWKVVNGNPAIAGFFDQNDVMFAGIGVDSQNVGYLAANRLKSPDSTIDAHIDATFEQDNVQLTFSVPKYSGSTSEPDGTTPSMNMGSYTGWDYDGTEYSNDLNNFIYAIHKFQIMCYDKLGSSALEEYGRITINQEGTPGLFLYSNEAGTERDAWLHGHVCTTNNYTNWECKGSIIPESNNLYNLGINAARWKDIYSNNSFHGSDRRFKKDISDIADSEKFIMGLRPRKYRMKGDDEKLHMGFIAQEVAEVMPEKFAGYNDNDPEALCLEYTEFIAPLVSLVQQQQRTIAMLQGRCEALEERVCRLEQMNRG